MDETMKNLIENNQPYEIEFKIKAVDTGEIKDIHSKAFFDAKKRMVFGVIQDITEKKKIFDQLQESEQKLSALFANMSEMVVINEMIFDERGQARNYKLLECNNAYTDITGIPREKVVGKLATEVYQTPMPPHIEEYARVCKTGKTAIFKNYFAPFDKHFLVSAISLGENRFSTVSNDITEILNSQEEVLRTNQELENYMYVASHDLRSPLVNIQGFSQRLSLQNHELNAILNECGRNCELKDKMLQLSEEKIPNSLQYIQTNVSKMDKLINGLLQISRTGRLVMDIRLLNMNNLIQNVLNAYNFQLTEIEATVLKGELSNCYGDENQLNQLFSNLIGNAIKYRDPRRKLILEISSKVNFNKVTYAVKDNGIGILPRHLEKIWDVFYRVDASDPDAGDGLGLSVARRIIDKHKGHISVESTEEVGSTFFVELSQSAQVL
jgi:signal transduction histidine kinase